MKRSTLLIALASLAFLPACQLINTALNLAPAALTVLEAPDTDHPVPVEPAPSAAPNPPEETVAEASQPIPIDTASLPRPR